MKKVEAINAWLDDQGYDWYAEEFTEYSDGKVIAMKPSMVAMPYPVLVTDDSILVNETPRLEIKIGIGSPEFFKELLKAMKVGWTVRKLNSKKTAWVVC